MTTAKKARRTKAKVNGTAKTATDTNAKMFSRVQYSFRDAGATDLSFRILPMGPDRAARIESRRRTEAFLAAVGPDL